MLSIIPAFSCFLLMQHNNQRNPLTKTDAEKNSALEQTAFCTHEIALAKLRYGAHLWDRDELEYERLRMFVDYKDIEDALAAPPCMGVSFETCKNARELMRNGVSIHDLTIAEYESLLLYLSLIHI